MGASSTVHFGTWGAAAFAAALAGAGAGVLGCDAPIARPAQIPQARAQVVVVDPAGAGACAVDDEEPEQWLPEDTCPDRAPDGSPERAAAKPASVEYVKISEWTPPPSVQALEASVPPRGDVPATYIQFPKLTKHSSIGGMHSRRH